jgi:ATP-dependent Clp protease ATP-binding subunit ClpB
MRMEIDSVPEEIDDLQRRIMQLEIEREAIRRENNKERETIISRELAELTEKKSGLMAKWQSEKSVLDNVRKIKKILIA